MVASKRIMLHSSNRNIQHSQKQSIIAEVEIVPRDHHFMSLGVFSEKDQPKGFSIKLEPQNELTERVDTQVSSKMTSAGIEYFLRITNNTNATFSAEIIQF